MAQGKPKRYSEEHLEMMRNGVVVYPGDESFIANMRSQGTWADGPTVTWEQFWEVSDQDVVDPRANKLDKRPRLEGDPLRRFRPGEDRGVVDLTHAYPGSVRRGVPGPVTPGESDWRRQHDIRMAGAVREGQLRGMENARAIQQATGTGVYAAPPATLPGAPTVGEATAAAQPYRDESAGLGVDTGYVPGMRRSISPQGTRANVDDSFDWRVRGVDPNKPWSGEMSAAERRRDELIALQKIQARRDQQIAEAKAKQEAMVSGQAAPTITETITQVDDDSIPDKRVIKKDYKPDFKRFTPGQDLGMVDPNQAYPGSVRRGVPGPVTPGRQFPSADEGKSILDRISEFGGSLNLPSAKNIWDFGGVVGAPSASDIAGGVGDFLTRKTAVADPRSAAGVSMDDIPAQPQLTPKQDPRFALMGQGPGTQMGYPDPSWTGEPPGESTPPLHPAVLARQAEQERIARERAGEFSSAFTPPAPARVETTPERINPVPLNERYPTVEDYIAQRQENEDARDEGREAENLSGIPLTLGGLDASSFGLDATGMLDKAMKGLEAGADVEEVLGDEGSGLLSFEEKHAPNFGVEPEDTRLPPQLRKDETQPDPEKSDVGGQDVQNAPPAVRAELERQWGKWTYNPKARREKFMSQLNAIYKKAAWLDAIAALTGGRSRSAQYIERAVGKLEAITKFDQEERLYNIWRDVYFDKDGNYNAPRSKREAAELARRLGASPAETKSIYGWAEEGEDLQQWHRIVDGEMQTITTEGKKTRPALGDSDVKWIIGKPPANWYSGTSAPSTKKSINPDGELVWATEAQIQSGGYLPLPANDPQGAAWERVAKEAEQYLQEVPPNEDAAMATWEMYYSSAKDPVTGHIFGADAAISQARLNIERSRRKMGLAGAGGPAPITEEQKVANANASDQEKVARMTTLKQEGLTQDQVKERMLLEGYDL